MSHPPKSNEPKTKSKPQPADPPVTDSPPGKTLQNWRPPMQSDEQVRTALDQAFDYRGDVTLETNAGERIEGYLYDRQTKDDQLTIRIMPNDGSRRRTLSQSQIIGLTFTGKDTAEGRSFEAWMKKYAEKKKAGQEASIYSDGGAEG